MSMKINDDQITTSTLNYSYRCYIQTLLTFDSSVKEDQLCVAGWTDDIPVNGLIEADDTNYGFTERSRAFRINNDVTKAYRPGRQYNTTCCIYDF